VDLVGAHRDKMPTGVLVLLDKEITEEVQTDNGIQVVVVALEALDQPHLRQAVQEFITPLREPDTIGQVVAVVAGILVLPAMAGLVAPVAVVVVPPLEQQVLLGIMPELLDQELEIQDQLEEMQDQILVAVVGVVLTNRQGQAMPADPALW
jgi:ammonia channel protein AmtB